MSNTIVIEGNLTRDPELRFTQGGTPVAALGVAVSRRFQVNNEWQEETSFFNVTVWSKLGEHVAASCQKGDRVLVEGYMKQREYEAQDGTARTAWDLIANAVGVSLRFATASITRVRVGGAPPVDESTMPASARQRETVGAPAQPPVTHLYGDEEPF